VAEPPIIIAAGKTSFGSTVGARANSGSARHQGSCAPIQATGNIAANMNACGSWGAVRCEVLCRGPDAVVERQAEAMRWLSRRCHNLQLEVLRLTVARER